MIKSEPSEISLSMPSQYRGTNAREESNQFTINNNLIHYPDQHVCVTGGLGYVASWLIKELLVTDPHYVIHATVRSIEKNQALIRECMTWTNAKNRLFFYEADLLKEGSFKSALDGCTMLFHTASPFFVKSSDPENDFIKPAVEGTENVLKTAAQAGVKKIVLTSSTAAVVSILQMRKDPKKVFSEADWNDINFASYWKSKVQAEKRAWELQKQHGFELVVCNPSWVIGPPALNRKDGESVGMLLSLLSGHLQKGVHPIFMTWVDVRDVARAHIFLMDNPLPKGRYICSSREEISMIELAQLIEKNFPLRFSLPKAYLSEKRLDTGQEAKPRSDLMNVDKIEQAGFAFHYHNLEKVMQDTVLGFQKLGMIKILSKL